MISHVCFCGGLSSAKRTRHPAGPDRISFKAVFVRNLCFYKIFFDGFWGSLARCQPLARGAPRQPIGIHWFYIAHAFSGFSNSAPLASACWPDFFFICAGPRQPRLSRCAKVVLLKYQNNSVFPKSAQNLDVAEQPLKVGVNRFLIGYFNPLESNGFISPTLF